MWGTQRSLQTYSQRYYYQHMHCSYIFWPLLYFYFIWVYSTKNVWNGNNSRIFVACIKWNHHYHRQVQIIISFSLFMLCLNHFHYEISQLYYILRVLLKTHSYHGVISTKCFFRFQNISLPQEPDMYNTLIRIHTQCTTHCNLVQLFQFVLIEKYWALSLPTFCNFRLLLLLELNYMLLLPVVCTFISIRY